MTLTLPVRPTTVTLVLLGILCGAGMPGEAATVPPLRMLRSFPVQESGASAVVYSWASDHFVLVGDAPEVGSGHSRLTGVSRFEDALGSLLLATEVTAPAMASFDRATSSLCLLDPDADRLVQISLDLGAGLDARASWHHDVRRLGLGTARGLSVDPFSGDVYLLDTAPTPRLLHVASPGVGGLASTLASGSLTVTPLPALLEHAHGLAFDPLTGLLYTLSAADDQLVALTPEGSVAATHDLSAYALHAPQQLVAAPDADPTNAPERTSLYILDLDASGHARLVELTFVDLDEQDQAEAAQNAVAALQATLVHTVHTSAYDPPSPDPAGITFIPSTGRLLISDSEVNEMSIFGANLFDASLSGSLGDTGESLDWSEEPTGVSYHPGNGTVFMSDDDFDLITEIDPGSDGIWGTNDDSYSSFDTREFDSQDPEGVCYDPVGDQLFVVDGEGREVYRLRPGPNGEFDGVEGDDELFQWDIGVLGAQDPEGIGYNPIDGTLFVSDTGEDQVLEMTTSGSLVRVIDLTSADPDNAAGVVYAPGSDNTNVMRLYIVDRGVDNDSDRSENDGKYYEFSIGDEPVANSPPTVNAGVDQSVLLSDGAVLSGSVSDDGLPDIPGQVTSTWSQVSGPGATTFGDPSAPLTVASFPTLGTYVLRLSADDGKDSTSDDIQINVLGGGGDTIAVRIDSGLDDAEETDDGTVTVSSGDLDMVTVGNSPQLVGLRFPGMLIPQGAVVLSAQIQFQTDETHSDGASFTVKGQAADHAPALDALDFNLSARTLTTAAVGWVPAPWPSVGDQGFAQQTPNIASVIQEIVGRPGWAPGNALALIISGTGLRTAESYDGDPDGAPLLEVQLQSEPGGNLAPLVNAGNDQAVILPAAANLDGTATDDGPNALVLTWSQVSGPGLTVFGDSSAMDTTATFPVSGQYVLRLTADDGLATSSDDVIIDVIDGVTGPGTIHQRIADGDDDGEEVSDGGLNLSSGDLEIVSQGGDLQTVGLRFANLAIPQGAFISSAYVQFEADEIHTGATSLAIRAEASDNASPFQNIDHAISSRPDTLSSVGWVPPPWTSVGAQGFAQRTPDLTAVLQEVVNRPGWAQGNALVLKLTGTGLRTATSFNGDDLGAPLLHIEFDTEPPANTPPTVSAGVNQSLTLPTMGELDGSVTDDDLPSVTTTWTQVSGPGPVAFVDASAVDTTAVFPAGGIYVLRLTADDGEFAPTDDVTIFCTHLTPGSASPHVRSSVAQTGGMSPKPASSLDTQ